MTKKEKQSVADDIENEGFDYTFRYLRSYDEMKDKKFVELVHKYQALCDEIEKYLCITNG